MGLQVIFTPRSLEDLEDIVTFIAIHNPDRAKTFGNELIDRALSIGTFPYIGRAVPEIGELTIREIIHGSYRIIYEILPGREAIFVLRLWHGARGEPEIESNT